MTSQTETPREASAELLQASIDHFARLTEPGPGVTRQGYTPRERAAHAYFADTLAALGAEVHQDSAGNTIGVLPPTADAGLRGAIVTGSHLDSVPQGGRFDGIVGVVGAMEVARLASARAERHRPWWFVAFAAEEGARFGQSCNGSRAVAGLSAVADLRRLEDADGVSMFDAMRDCLLQPDRLEDARWTSADVAAFIELHIEQGGVLEAEGFDIGIVDDISGSVRLAVHVSGVSSHSGATPMSLRQDALVTASRCVLEGERLANDPANASTRITVGRMTVGPGSITTIPGTVDFTVDIRDTDPARQQRVAAELTEAYRRIGSENSTPVTVRDIGSTPPMGLDERLGTVVGAAADSLSLRALHMTSGASHDAQQISTLAPTSMVFVPSRGGLSHVPDEYSSAEQLRAGTAVLFETMLRLDQDLSL